MAIVHYFLLFCNEHVWFPPLHDFSPYELVFLKKPPDILNLYFEPLETITKGCRDYCLKMRMKLDNVSSFVNELKTFQQQSNKL